MGFSHETKIASPVSRLSFVLFFEFVRVNRESVMKREREKEREEKRREIDR